MGNPGSATVDDKHKTQKLISVICSEMHAFHFEMYQTADFRSKLSILGRQSNDGIINFEINKSTCDFCQISLFDKRCSVPFCMVYQKIWFIFFSIQASVCRPILTLSADAEPSTKASNVHLMIETEMKTSAKDYTDLTLYLYATLIRNGFVPTESIKSFMSTLGHIDWEEDYLTSVLPLRELCVRLLRSRTYLSGNIIYGTNKLHIPNRLKDLIIMSNPF